MLVLWTHFLTYLFSGNDLQEGHCQFQLPVDFRDHQNWIAHIFSSPYLLSSVFWFTTIFTKLECFPKTVDFWGFLQWPWAPVIHSWLSLQFCLDLMFYVNVRRKHFATCVVYCHFLNHSNPGRREQPYYHLSLFFKVYQFTNLLIRVPMALSQRTSYFMIISWMCLAHLHFIFMHRILGS